MKQPAKKKEKNHTFRQRHFHKHLQDTKGECYKLDHMIRYDQTTKKCRKKNKNPENKDVIKEEKV